MPRYYLGVDGGQSSTTAMIGDETGQIVGVGHAGPCNHVSGAEARAKLVAALESAIGHACTEAGLNAASIRFASACLGFSGGPADKEVIVGELLPSDRTFVTDDALIALAGATAGQPGIVVIAGTGSIALGRNSSNHVARAGGWGYLFGDEGGAFWIASQALRSALRFEEGWGAPSSLRARLLDATQTRNINDLMHRCYTAEVPRPNVAALSRLVNQAAEENDPAALDILDSAAHELARLAIAVRGQLFEKTNPALVSYCGGVFHSRTVLNRFRHWMAAEEGLRVAAPMFGPANGALLESYRVGGLNTLPQPSSTRHK